MEKIRVSYAVMQAINCIHSGFGKNKFLHWAASKGLSISTAYSYWSMAKKLTKNNPDAHFYCL